ncbi:hypothetical protein ACWDBW_15450 [Streptomyces sp. NPDC001107]
MQCRACRDGRGDVGRVGGTVWGVGMDGILGVKVPKLSRDGWRLFWTQQHGDNRTWEITPADK